MCTIAICAIARFENRYIKEWVDYHLSLGFDYIYLYDNNREGEERIASVLNVEKEYKNRVIIVPYHHFSNDQCPQMRAYADCYERNECEWIAFIDIDEFITLSPKSKLTNIKQLLHKCSSYDAILLNWMTYGDNEKVFYEDAPVLLRFPKPMPYRFSQYNMWGSHPINGHVKTIIRKDLNFRVNGPHVFYGPKTCCNGDGESVENIAYQPKITFKTAYIRHYVTKSLEEYIEGKMKRQAADQAQSIYNLTSYFERNKPSLAKYRIYEEFRANNSTQRELSLMWWLKQIIKQWVIAPLFLWKV